MKRSGPPKGGYDRILIQSPSALGRTEPRTWFGLINVRRPAMKCPRDQALLSLRSIEGHSGYRCPRCHGGWLPAKFIQSLEYSREFKYSAFTEAIAQGASHVTALACPAGCGHLHATRFADIPLCWCPVCQGSWFDFG